nr:hypothetical protein [uncultured Flavobacterium sp.]
MATKLSAPKSLIGPLIIGTLFFVGGVTMILQLPQSPMWFNVTDLLLAYFPMAYLGFLLGKR